MRRQVVAVAGATGYLGRTLTETLLADYHVIGLTRNSFPERCSLGRGRCPVEWRRADFYSLKQAQRALAGVDIAFYLVHSMMPSAHLTQGDFLDFDLIMADNFARAAAKNGVKHIIYVGGLLPQGELSSHLRSRHEVETTLGSRGVPVTAIRAGVVIGPGGSSFHILTSLIKRLKVIPCPPCSRSLMQPIDLDDMISILKRCLEDVPSTNRIVNVGSDEVLSYREVLERTARVMKLQRYFLPLPWNFWWFLKLGMSWISGMPRELTSPLAESMQYAMVAPERTYQIAAGISGNSFENSVEKALHGVPEASRHRCCPAVPTWLRNFRKRDVRSVQRIRLPAGRSAAWMAHEYAHWHPMFFRSFIKAEVCELGNVRILLRFFNVVLLELTRVQRSTSDRQLFFVAGGLLVRKSHDEDEEKRARLEFREVLNKKFVVVGLHDYKPMLPWLLYSFTQALMHLWFMSAFAKHVEKIADCIGERE